ncbi:MAG: DUF1365 domain-containing protein [Pseudomonadota bacterium]
MTASDESVQASNAALNDAPASLYVGQVMHARLKPFGHRFTYSVFNLLIDIDRLDEAARQSRLFAVNGMAPVSFYEKDHGDGRAGGLNAHIREQLSEAGASQMPDRILLLCYPRVFGYVFNPISVYFCERNGDLVAMVYEVRNTFGGKHTYVEPVREGQMSPGGLRQECGKLLHVSPFIDMPMRYFFRLKRPAHTVSFRILEKDESGPLLSATLHAKHQHLTSRALALLLAKMPLLTAKVTLAIHYEALKLWFKGAKFHPNPHRKGAKHV